ncbi:MoaD/ThiS family protein [Lactobacillus helveticus]
MFNTTLNEPRKLCRVLVNGELAQFNQTLKTTDSVALVGVVTCDG